MTIRCVECKCTSFVDEHYQVICTNCGLCDAFEPVPDLDSVQSTQVHDKKLKANLADPSPKVMIPFGLRRMKKHKVKEIFP